MARWQGWPRRWAVASAVVLTACGGSGDSRPAVAGSSETGVQSSSGPGSATSTTDPDATDPASTGAGSSSSAATTAQASDSSGAPDRTTGIEGPFILELPLVDADETIAVVESFGGSVQGGVFGPDGWTTQTRDDIITIPLPASTPAATGVLEFSVANFEWDLTSTFWEAWVLVSLDSEGPPFSPTDAGTQSGLQALYFGFNPDDPGRGYRPVGYFNLFDRACPGWEDCTGEARTPPLWLSADGTVYTLTHAWNGAVDDLTFAGNGVVDETVDLTATSPNGAIVADALYLTINACGGSAANTCGPWDGPADVKGGPIGVTYSDLRLDLTP